MGATFAGIPVGGAMVAPEVPSGSVVVGNGVEGVVIVGGELSVGMVFAGTETPEGAGEMVAAPGV